MSATVDLPGAVSHCQAIVIEPETASSDMIPLVRAARSGDRDAVGQLYDRYVRMVHGILLAQIPPREVADLVHDVFLLALRQIHTLRDEAAFGGWLASIARNRATDHHRRFVPTAPLPDGLESPGGHESAGLAVLCAAGARRAYPGTPLVCQPSDIGDAVSLPWGARGSWDAPNSAYDRTRVVGDTLVHRDAELSPEEVRSLCAWARAESDRLRRESEGRS